MSEIAPLIASTTRRTVQSQETLLGRVSAVVVDMHTQRAIREDQYGSITSVDDMNPDLGQKEDKPKCFGGCSEIIKKKNWLEDLNNSSERSGNDISTIATEAATDAVFAKLEFFKGQTLFHVSYTKTSGNRWENSGRDLVELFDENKPGGDRKFRYEQLKNDMQRAKVEMVFSEPTVTDNLNYIHVFVNAGATVEEYIVQYQGTQEDFSNLYQSFSKTSNNPNSTVDFNVPMSFAQDVPLDSFTTIIEDSYVNAENREQAGDYLRRLTRDVANLSRIDDYQKEAKDLANYLEKQMLSQGISHAILNFLAGDLDAYAKGNESIEDLTRKNTPEVTVTDVYGYIQNRTNEIANRYDGEDKNIGVKPVQTILDIMDGKRGESVRILLTTDTTTDTIRPVSSEIRWIQIAEKELGISEKEVRVLELSIVKLHEMFAEQKQAVDFVAGMKVGYGAAFFALDVMTISDVFPRAFEETESSTNIAELVRSSEQRMETGSLEFITHLTPKEINRIFSLFTVEPDANDILEIQNVLPAGIDAEVFVKTVEFIRHIDSLPAAEKESAIIQEKEKTFSEMIFIWDYLTEIIVHNRVQMVPENTAVTFHSPREFISREKTEAQHIHEEDTVRNFSIAFMIWTILKMSGYYANLEFVHTLAIKNDKHTFLRIIQKEKPGDIIQKESAPWLLFSIIWYLAMIREQGTVQGAQQVIKQKKKIQQYAFNQQAVIFAFSS